MLFLIGILLGIFSVIFAFQNVTPVTVNILQWQLDGSLAFIILLAMAAGMLIFAFLTLPSAFRDSIEFSALQKHNKRLTKELEVHKEILTETQSKLADVASVPQNTVIIEKNNTVPSGTTTVI